MKCSYHKIVMNKDGRTELLEEMDMFVAWTTVCPDISKVIQLYVLSVHNFFDVIHTSLKRFLGNK